MTPTRSFAAAAVVFGAIVAGCTTGAGGHGAATTSPTSTVAPTTTFQTWPGPDCPLTNGLHQANSDLGIACDLRGLTLDDIDIPGPGTYGPDLHLEHSTVTNSNFGSANLKYLHGEYLTLTNVNLSNTNLPSSNFSNTTWKHVNASGAYLGGSDFSIASFTDVDLTGANLQGTTWTGATLGGAIGLSTSTICPDGAAYDINDLCRGSLPGF